LIRRLSATSTQQKWENAPNLDPGKATNDALNALLFLMLLGGRTGADRAPLSTWNNSNVFIELSVVSHGSWFGAVSQ
jgi:hypothetical protein